MDQVYETRKLAGKAIRQMIDELDPFAAYQIWTGNGSYSDEANGVRFVNGRGNVEALPADADGDEIRERREQLAWFLNCEPKEVTVRIEYDPNLGTRTPTYGWRLAYRLEKAGEPAAPAKKEKAASAA